MCQRSSSTTLAVFSEMLRPWALPTYSQHIDPSHNMFAASSSSHVCAVCQHGVRRLP